MKKCISWRMAAILLVAFMCISPLVGCKPEPTATPTAKPTAEATATPRSSKATVAPTTDASESEIPSVSKDDLDTMLDSYALNIQFGITDPQSEDVTLDIELLHQAEPMRELMDIKGTSAEETQHLKIYNDEDLTAFIDLTEVSPEWAVDESAYWMINTYASIVSMTIDPMVGIAEATLQGTERIDGRTAYHYTLDEDALREAMANDDAGIVLTNASCELWIDTEVGVVLKAELQGEGRDDEDSQYLVDIVWEVSEVNSDLGLTMPDIAEASSQTGDVVPMLSIETADSFQLQTLVTLKNGEDELYYEARYDFCQEGSTLVRMFDFSFDEPDSLTTLSIYAENDDAWISVNGEDYTVADGNYSDVLDYLNGWWLIAPTGLVSDALGVASSTERINGIDAIRYIADTSTVAAHPDISSAESDGTLEYWVSSDANQYLLQVVMNVVATPAVFSKTHSFEIEYESQILSIDELDDIERPANLPEIEASATADSSNLTDLIVGGVAAEEFLIDDLVMPEDLATYRLYQYMFDGSQDSSPDVITESIEEMNRREGERHIATCTRTGSTEWEEYIQTSEGTWFGDGYGFESSTVDILDDASLSDPWVDDLWDLFADEAGTLVGVDDFMGRDACCYAWQLDDFDDVGPVEALLWVDARTWTPLLLSVSDTFEGSYFHYEYSVTDANNSGVRVTEPNDLPAANALYFANNMNLYDTVGEESNWYKLIVKPCELLDTHLMSEDVSQDLVLTVYDSNGGELAWGDDSPESYMPWVIYRPTNAGVVFLELEVYDQDSTGSFELQQSTFEGATLEDAPQLETGSIEGIIAADDYVGIEYYNEVCYGHAWYVYLDDGDTIDITCLADSMGSPLDPGVHLLNSEGEALASDDDSYGDGSTYDSHLVYEIDESGRYYILVQSVNMMPYGDDYAFNLIVDGID